MHWRESSLRKASNTAKLVPMLLEDGGIIAAGDVAAEASLFHLLYVNVLRSLAPCALCGCVCVCVFAFFKKYGLTVAPALVVLSTSF